MYLEMFTMLHFRNSISRSLRNSQPMWSACRRRISTSTRVCYKAKENDLGFGPIKSPERPFEGLKLVTGLKIESEPDTDDSDVSEGEDQGDFENPIEEGQFHCRTLQLPDALKATIYQLTSGRSVRQMRKDVERLDYFLHTRTSSSVDYEPFSTGNPMHRETKNEKVARIMKDQKISKSKAQRMMAMAADGDETSLEMVDKRLHFGTKRSDGTTLLTSNSIAYGVNEGVAYAVSRLPAVYSAAYRVLLEIYCRDFDWTPKTALDFGSGVGTSMWAAHTLWEADTKYVNIDMSDDMNTISAFLNKDGAGHPIHNVKYRKFMPVLNKVKHDLVTCCFSLCELPSLEARKQAVENLWSQTDQYLVIVEPGTQEGFRNIREARKWIIGEADAELIAPCPHDDDCPMEANEKVCKFPQRVLYSRAQQEIMSSHRMKSQNYKMQTFSFLVIARNSHEGTANVRNSVTRKWTRLTVPTLKRTGHVICDGCTESGQLQRTIRTKAEGKTAFKDLRKRKWGDALPPAEFYQSLLDEPIPA